MRLRCVLAMLGTDVHDKGIRVLGRQLRDAGVEIIYLGPHNLPGNVAAAATSEDADVVGISFSTSTYLHHTRALATALRDAGWDGALMVGGLIHADDIPELRDIGVDGIFAPGSRLEDVLEFLETVSAGTEFAIHPRPPAPA